MQTIEMKSLVKQGHVINFSCLRENVNGYLYVTMLGSEKGTSQNVYFGKDYAAELRKKYDIEGVSITDADNIQVLMELAGSVVVQTLNADEEVRYKVGRTTKYASQTALAAAFGLELDEQPTDFDIDDFMAGFEAKPEEKPLTAKEKKALEAKTRVKAKA